MNPHHPTLSIERIIKIPATPRPLNQISRKQIHGLAQLRQPLSTSISYQRHSAVSRHWFQRQPNHVDLANIIDVQLRNPTIPMLIKLDQPITGKTSQRVTKWNTTHPISFSKGALAKMLTGAELTGENRDPKTLDERIRHRRRPLQNMGALRTISCHHVDPQNFILIIIGNWSTECKYSVYGHARYTGLRGQRAKITSRGGAPARCAILQSRNQADQSSRNCSRQDHVRR
jgi:hypothetical protein